MTYCLVKLRPYLTINTPTGSKTRNPTEQRMACVFASFSTGVSGKDEIADMFGGFRMEKVVHILNMVS
jgi:hypothetical protein